MYALLKDMAWRKTKGKCAVCDRQIHGAEWHLTHDIARASGGTDTLPNLWAAHPKCNLSMSTKTINEARAILGLRPLKGAVDVVKGVGR